MMGTDESYKRASEKLAAVLWVLKLYFSLPADCEIVTS